MRASLSKAVMMKQRQGRPWATRPVAAEGRVRAARQDLLVIPRTGSFHRRVIDRVKEEQAVLERQVPAEPAEL